jgi:hypothetical protein
LADLETEVGVGQVLGHELVALPLIFGREPAQEVGRYLDPQIAGLGLVSCSGGDQLTVNPKVKLK